MEREAIREGGGKGNGERGRHGILPLKGNRNIHFYILDTSVLKVRQVSRE